MLRIGVVGASGYTSSELLRFLITHPEDIEISLLTSTTYQGQKVGKVMPSLRGILDREFEEFSIDEVARRCDLVFLALPHKVAMEYAPSILERGVRLIDFSADYRLKSAEVYEASYGVPHGSPELLSRAVYGLPELYRHEIKGADLVANPGCYPTATILAVAPLMRTEGLIDRSLIVVDAKSGVSGAGSKPSEKTHYPSRTENFEPYNVLVHRHAPEMEQEIELLSGCETKVAFVPHLVPMSRGILSTIYLRKIGKTSVSDLLDLYNEFYKGEPFVRVLDQGEYPCVKAVCGSNYCDIGITMDDRTGLIVVMSAIDNLVKGASGQAIQNMNLMFGFPEKAGIDLVPLMP